MMMLGDAIFCMYDPFGHVLSEDGATYPVRCTDAQYLVYSTNGLLASISNSDVVIAYNYSPDLKDVGYTMAFADGGTFVSVAVRDPYRRDIVLSVANSCGGNTHTLEYSYDALSRPISRNADTFGYNDRSEVSSANIGGNSETHEYDDIGNATVAAFNFATNIYTASSLNQYTSILCDAGTLRETSHDADGNLTFDGVFTYAYDADNRLASVSSNGLVLVMNQYDHKGRRVRKTTPTSVTTFLYDGWNLIYEREIAGTVTNETYYYWGKDISGSLQGAGGVGGLLYLKRNGTIYIPHRDANGNIVRYTDAAGNVVASYTYGAFGNTLSATGAIADVFHFRFSTKYYDAETGLYYYGYRFYSPLLMRWLNRDPIEENGGENLSMFVFNNPMSQFDADGRVVMPITITPSDSYVTAQGSQTPTFLDQIGSGTGPFHEEKWFEANYSGWINAAKSLFITEINKGIDCKNTQLNIKSSRQSVDPGIAGYIPWEMPVGGSDRLYGDNGQNNWQATLVLGKFAIDYVTPITIKYSACNNGKRTYSWSTTMYVEDSLGLQGAESWLGKYFGWAAKSRRARRAHWIINGSGTCNCCE